jgi:hypothetical protein
MDLSPLLVVVDPSWLALLLLDCCCWLLFSSLSTTKEAIQQAMNGPRFVEEKGPKQRVMEV